MFIASVNYLAALLIKIAVKVFVLMRKEVVKKRVQNTGMLWGQMQIRKAGRIQTVNFK